MNKAFYVWLGKRLAKIREKHRLTRSEVGKAIGVSENVIQNWEIARSRINADDLYKLSQLYEVSLDEIMNKQVVNKDYEEIFEELLDCFDEEQIYRRYYSLDENSKNVVRIVLEQQEELWNLRNDQQSEPTLIAASGAENLNEEERKALDKDIEMVRNLGKKS